VAEHPEAPAPAERPEGAKPEEEARNPPPWRTANIRVGVVLLDKLMDLVGELVLTRNQILQFNYPSGRTPPST